MPKPISVEALRYQIDSLLREFPELVTDDDLRRDTLEGSTDLPEIMNELVAVTEATSTLIDALSERIDRLQSRRARLARRIESARHTVLAIMQAAGLKKLELPEATISQRASQPMIVGNINADELPDKFVRIKREPNKTAIREALLKGDLIPGLYLSNAPPGLIISTK